MSVPALNWRTVTDSRSPKFFVKHTRLAVALYRLSRFAINEMRGPRNEDGSFDDYYLITDAQTVSDADVKAGKEPLEIFRTKSLSLLEALDFCDKAA